MNLWHGGMAQLAVVGHSARPESRRCATMSHKEKWRDFGNSLTTRHLASECAIGTGCATEAVSQDAMKGWTTMDTDTDKIVETEKADKIAKHELTVSPAARIIESDVGYEIRLDMPGAIEKTVEIGIDDGVLSIDAVREEDSVEGGRLIREEFPMADYHADYEIPDRVDVEAIKARLANGILTIVLPKRAEARSRKIVLGA